jgi:uncharacterized membrane protein YedE/YeeE
LRNSGSAARSFDTNRLVLGTATALLVALAWIVTQMPGARWQMPLLVLTGASIGFVLYRATFGFSNAFRWLLDERNGRGIAAHAVMLALTSLLFFPILSLGQIGDVRLSGAATPIGVGFALGAVLFGIGMQIGGGCASGTLFSLGGGNGKLIATLLFFVVGSTFGAAHMGFWWSLPTGSALTMQGSFGWPLGLALQLGLLFLIWLGARRLLATGQSEEERSARQSLARRLTQGPWPLVWGGVALALLNAVVLVLSGKPWGETSAFALWGSKLVNAIGMDAHNWGLCQAARPVGAARRDLGHGLRHPAWRRGCGGRGRRVPGPLGRLAQGLDRRRDRRLPHGLRRPHVERLQHRRLFQRHRRRQRLGLGLDGVRDRRQLYRHPLPAALRPLRVPEGRRGRLLTPARPRRG